MSAPPPYTPTPPTLLQRLEGIWWLLGWLWAPLWGQLRAWAMADPLQTMHGGLMLWGAVFVVLSTAALGWFHAAAVVGLGVWTGLLLAELRARRRRRR